jgi:hypothetical protein
MLLTFCVACGSSKEESPTPPTTDAPDVSSPDTGEPTQWQFELVKGPLTLNSDGRAVFANVLLDGETVIATYQTAPPDTLNTDKNLYFRTYDRSLGEIDGEETAIDVHVPLTIDGKDVLDFDGDLGGHKLVLMNDLIYFVAILKGREDVAYMAFDKSFKPMAGPLYFGIEQKKIEAHLDMGFCGDGHHLYAQFFYQNGETPPEEWGASIYQLSPDMEQKNHALVYPDEGTFVTGTSCVFVPAGQMGVTADRLQIFSTNKAYGDPKRVGIHTFAADMMLEFVAGSRSDIIVEDLDVYFPTGPSYNATHQLWVVGYTMENAEGEHGMKDKSVELGPSFIQIFDADWKPIQTIPVNGGEAAFRVMTQTEGDDLYVVFDEMDKYGWAESSRARIEHYRISKVPSQ